MSLTRDQANTNTLAVISTIQTAADTQFIAATDLIITNTIALGQYKASVTTFDGVNIQAIYSHYTGLGYIVTFPDMSSALQSNPSQLFGYLLAQFYAQQIANQNLKNPARMVIDWS